MSRLPGGSGPTVPAGRPEGGRGPQTPDSADSALLLPCYFYYIQLLQGLPGGFLSTYCVPSPGLRLCLDGLSGATQQTWEMRLSPAHKSQDRGSSAREQQRQTQTQPPWPRAPPEKRAPLRARSAPRSLRPSLGSGGPFRPTFPEGRFPGTIWSPGPGHRGSISSFLGKPRRHFEEGQNLTQSNDHPKRQGFLQRSPWTLSGSWLQNLAQGIPTPRFAQHPCHHALPSESQTETRTPRPLVVTQVCLVKTQVDETQRVKTD